MSKEVGEMIRSRKVVAVAAPGAEWPQPQFEGPVR